MVVVWKVTGRRSAGWKISQVEGRSGRTSWCHKSWCSRSSVKGGGAKGHQAKGHGVTGQNLEIKDQKVKAEISVMKRCGSVQNNKHGSKLTCQKWKVRELKVGQGQRLWRNCGRSVKGHGSKVGRVKGQWRRILIKSKIFGVIGHGVQDHRSKMLVPRVIRQKLMGSQVGTRKSKARKSKVKYQWWRGVDRSKIINMARNSQVKNERLRSQRSVRSKIMA